MRISECVLMSPMSLLDGTGVYSRRFQAPKGIVLGVCLLAISMQCKPQRPTGHSQPKYVSDTTAVSVLNDNTRPGRVPYIRRLMS